MKPQNYIAYFNKGMMCLMLGDIDDAKLLFEKTLEINPKFENAREQLNALK